MLDIKFIRAFPDTVKEAIQKRNVKNVDIDEILDLDKTRLDILRKLENHRALKNELSEKIAATKDSDTRKALINEATPLKEELNKLESDLKILEGVLEEKLLLVPNIPSDDTPMGTGDPDHIEIKAWLPNSGYIDASKLGKGDNLKQHMPKPSFELKDQLELGKLYDMIDTEQSGIVSGSRFGYLKNDAVLIYDALSMLLKKKLLSEGFTPMIVPLLVRDRVLYGTSHFPEGRDQVYKIDSEHVENNAQLYLVGSSEPPLFAYYMDKVLTKEQLPQKMYAQTSCFRTEVGSWGRDVRGIKRMHQFEKLEMDVVCTQENSMEIMEYLLSINEWFYQTLELPYRVIHKCSGDMGYNASHKQYDIELWLPGDEDFIEVGSDTNALEYQARRLNIRYRDGSDLKYAHTVNDTGIPFSRVLIAILDNYQQEDGTIRIPKALQEYMGKEVIS